MIDIKAIVLSQKVMWIKKYLSDKEYLLKHTMKNIITIKDLDSYLKSNCDLPKQFSMFYKDVLICWDGVKKTNIEGRDDVLEQFLCRNRSIDIYIITVKNI